MKRIGHRLLPCLLMLLLIAGTSAQPYKNVKLVLTEAELDWVGQRIFGNECAGKTACLVHWNRGEAFPSLGIGHFIWYPKGVTGPFVESFPALVGFMREQGATLPAVLARLDPLAAPWPHRESFLAQQNSPDIQQLRDFLERTRGLQAAFIFNRAQASLSRVLDAAPPSQRDDIHRRLAALSETPGGVYALIDYVNFKGEGLAPTEAYQGQGWGLLQVLQQMATLHEGTALQRFRQAAAAVLTRRAHNAKAPIEQDQWLSGWLNRLQTYSEPADEGQ